MALILQMLWVICNLGSSFMITNREELILQDPNKWPGHLEPFGSKQRTGKVEEIHTWPDPTTFFREYVDKSRPVLLKGVAKQSPAYTKFEDDYFRNAKDADKTIIYAEPELKENRTKKGFEISFKEFIERYHKETLYMVYSLPPQFTPDVRMPAPLRCESTKNLMSSQVTWFSSGGTKSVLHNDDVDNINCLFRGSKELWFIEYNKNKLFVPIDRTQGGYSSLDVEKVNYTQFPDLRKVDMYYKAVMEEGDCLFIPYHWFHQVNSLANDRHMNLAVNVWFRHEIGHIPEGCSTPEEEATIDKYDFPDDEAEKVGQESIIDHFSEYIPEKKYLSSKVFLKVLGRDPLVNPTSYKFESSSDAYEAYKVISEKLFNHLDINQDGKLSRRDFNQITKLEESKMAEYEDLLNGFVADAENVFEDTVDDVRKGKISDDSADSLPATDNEKIEL